MDPNCVFCKIVAGEIPSQKEYEDEEILVFPDIHPHAPTHLLIIPKEHITEFKSLEDLGIWTKMSKVAQDLIKKLNLSGYRLVNNGGEAVMVEHLHMHLLGGISKEREV